MSKAVKHGMRRNHLERQKNMLLDMVTFIAVIAALLFMVFSMSTKADPEGATLQYVGNSTKNTTSPEGRADQKGYIHIITLNSQQQNNKWKAYVGNVSGTLVLRDGDGY